MKKRTAVIGALISLLPLGQPLVIGSGAALTSSAMMLALPEKAQAECYELYFNREYKKGEEGDYYGAISDYNKAIEINPSFAGAYFNRGISKDYSDDPYGAISDFNNAIKIEPKDGNYYRSRGITKKEIGDMKGACSDWRKESSLGYEDAEKWVRNEC